MNDLFRKLISLQDHLILELRELVTWTAKGSQSHIDIYLAEVIRLTAEIEQVKNEIEEERRSILEIFNEL